MSGEKSDWLFGKGGIEGIRESSERMQKSEPTTEPSPKPASTAESAVTPAVDRGAETELVDLEVVSKAIQSPISESPVDDRGAFSAPLLDMNIVPAPLQIDIRPPIPPLESTVSPEPSGAQESDPKDIPGDQIQGVANPFATPVPPMTPSGRFPAPSPEPQAGTPLLQLVQHDDDLEEMSLEEASEMFSSRAIQRPDAVSSLSDDSEELEAISPEEAATMLGGAEAPASSDDGRSTGQSVRKALESNSEQITLRALSKRGLKNVRVMDISQIQHIVTEAVDKVLERRSESMTKDEREELEREAKKEFFELLAEHKKVVAQKSEVERARDSLQGQVSTLTGELDGQVRKLEEENKRHAEAGNAEFSAASFDQMEAHIRAIFKRLITDETRQALAVHGASAVPGLEALEDAISTMLEDLISRERDKAINDEQAAHQQRVQILEARIRKLNSALTDTEGALQKVAAMKQIDLGVSSIYGGFQGLDFGEGNFEKKSELLKTLFLENLELQGKDVTEEDKDGTLEVEEAPRNPGSILELPEGFSAPVDVDALTGESAF
jgi:hypothetical protein